MQRFLRDRSSGLFFNGDDGWTPNFAEARGFADTNSLLKAALQTQRRDLEEILMFGQVPSEYDVALPILPRS